ncbi:hypothetical protein DRN77_05385 [Methanosarcinales archaeon]|nr:MAG: hypothetical protein DRN77_05385 [Methanosarcinales archaeon]
MPRYAMKWMFAACLMLALCASHVGGEPNLVWRETSRALHNRHRGWNGRAGYSIDLLELVLVQPEEAVSVSYHVDPDIPTHLASIREERVNFGIAATTITSERLGFFEFSHPFYLADPGIIAEKEPTPDLLSQNFSQKFYACGNALLAPRIQKLSSGWGLFVYFPIASRNVVFGIILAIVYMIIAGHIIWLIEREKDGHFHKNLPPGRLPPGSGG